MATKENILKHCLPADSECIARGEGRNVITPPEKESLWRQYLEKFKDPIIVVLLVVFCLSVAISLYEILWIGKGAAMLLEPCGVLVALLLATGIAFIFEVKANREFEILNKVKDDRPVVVYRAVPASSNATDALVARPFEIKRQDVVVGDVVYLESGDEVPADGELILSNSLKVDESKFTGEVYAKKSENESEQEADATYPSNFLLRGAMILEGNCYYKVTAVGDDTEEGRGVALTREGSQVQTPLNQQLDQLGGGISKASFVVATLIIIGRTIIFFSKGYGAAGAFDWLHFAEFMLSSIMIAVTLIVVAVPEGLPMSVTVSLALSMRKMLKANNLVRKLHACETMGATTVICTDKTGTLTQNQMVVVATDFYGESAQDIIRQNIAINSTAELSLENGALRVIGNPTEGALLKWLHSNGCDYAQHRHQAKIVNQKPFSTETKYMESVVRVDENRNIRFIKGAPEILLDMCSTIANGVSREQVLQRLTEYQNRAMRTLGFAYQNIVSGVESELTFVGVVGIADPVREDVVEAINICKNMARVRVIIVTGDTPGTANEIGRQIGLLAPDEAPQSVTGPEFAAMSDEQALELVKNPNFKIISRARPDDKARLVTLLQRAGEVVAVTGDGTNDAPALSKAQVGLSMGDGTSRAKEASDITIIDNSFASINKAIMWGRSLYLNIRRFIVFQMTINLCACLVVLLGAFLGLESPLTVTQMLWVNLIMDTFAAMALSSLPPDPSVLNGAPRNPNSHIIDKPMLKRIVGTGLFFFVFLASLWQLLRHIEANSVAELFTLHNLQVMFAAMFDVNGVKPQMCGHDLGVFFSTFVLLQFWNLFNAKYFRTKGSLIGDIVDLFRGRKRVAESYSAGFVWIMLVILLGQIAIVTFAGQFFSVEPLSVEDWGLLLLITSPVLIVPDIYRLLTSKR